VRAGLVDAVLLRLYDPEPGAAAPEFATPEESRTMSSTIKPPPHPSTIIYGTKKPELRLRSSGETQSYFCLNNHNLPLSPSDFNEGTFEAGMFLERLHQEFCRPGLGSDQPCPALVETWKIGTENKGLASVEMRAIPSWELCAGIQTLLNVADTSEERAFLLAYLDDKWSDESKWRDGLVSDWNARWGQVENGWGKTIRRAKFESMLWATLRFPALIPQVWLNWLHAAPEAVIRDLDRNPSRVDFVAFWRGTRHVIEIDGPSHYADWNGSGYKVDERAYARNLKIERSLRKQLWEVTRIGRIEVVDAVSTEDFEQFLKWAEVLDALPFHRNEGYPKQSSSDGLMPELAVFSFHASDDDIPF
jgi:hypothetical protein